MERITAEQMKMLQGLTSFSPAAATWFEAPSHTDLPEEIRPQFKLRALKQNELVTIKKLLANIDKAKEDELKEYARYCVLDWTKWYDSGTGEAVEFKLGGDGFMDKEIFNLIPVSVVMDIIRQILKISGLMTLEKAGL